MINNKISAAVHRSIAKVCSFLQRTDIAISEFNKAVEKHPDDAESWRCLGFLYAQKKSHALSISAFRTCLELLPQDNDTRFNLGFVLHETGEITNAIQIFREVILQNANHDRAWYGMGICLADLGQLEDAIDAMKRASTLQYFNPHAGYKLAQMLMLAERGPEANEEYLRVLTFDPAMAAQIKQVITTSTAQVKLPSSE